MRLLGDYAGRLVSDGCEGYVQVVRQDVITHAGCWAHARRKFTEAQKAQPKGKADWARNQIRKLYAVAKQAKGRERHPLLRGGAQELAVQSDTAWCPCQRGDLQSEELVAQGSADDFRAYLTHIAEGGYG